MLSVGAVGIGRVAVVGALCLFGAACGRRSPPPPSGLSVEPHADLATEADLGLEFQGEGYLAFRITHVYQDAQPTDAPPWHSAGGPWTFFDATLAGDPAVPFTVGVKGARSTGASFAGSEAIIAVPDQEIGSRFVERFARAFHTAVPAPAERRALRPTPFPTAMLGESMKREKGGFRSAGTGNWTASKWFFEDNGNEAEVFFNFSVSDGVGEFSEKDEDYRQALVAELAHTLRDGSER